MSLSALLQMSTSLSKPLSWPNLDFWHLLTFLVPSKNLANYGSTHTWPKLFYNGDERIGHRFVTKGAPRPIAYPSRGALCWGHSPCHRKKLYGLYSRLPDTFKKVTKFSKFLAKRLKMNNLVHWSLARRW